MEIKLPKLVAFKNEDVSFEYEILGDSLILHCEVSKWTHNTCKYMLMVFDLFKQDAIGKGYTRLLTFSPNPAFARLFGGACIESLIFNGQYVEVLTWELKQP